MAYSYRLFHSVAEVPTHDWDVVQCAAGTVFTDLRFLRTVERSMAADTRCWPVLIYDDAQPVAIAGLSLYSVDATAMAARWVARLVTWIRRFLPRLLYFKVAFCGLPVSAGQQVLASLPTAKGDEVARLLDRALLEVARNERAWLLVLKEFSTPVCDWLDALRRQHHYLRADSLPMNRLERPFASFAEYLAARGRRTRHNIRHSQQKFHEAGLEIRQLAGHEGAAELFTDEAYRLYLAVVEQAPSRIEILPAEFFRELARQFGDRSHFTFIYQGSRLAGVSCSLLNGDRFHLLFCGFDYALNETSHLYFNLMFADLDRGFRLGAAVIDVGQNSDSFKARLGCRQVPLFFYIKGRWILRPLLRLYSRWLLPPVPLLPPANVFRGAQAESRESAAAE